LNEKLSDGGFINLSGYLSRRQRSDKDYTDFSGNTYKLNNNSGISNNQILLNAGYKGLRINGLFDNSQLYSRDIYGQNARKTYPINFPVTGFQISAPVDLNKHWKITPAIGLLIQKLYSNKNAILESIDNINIGRFALYDFNTIHRLTNNFVLRYANKGWVELDFKGEYIEDFFYDNEKVFPNDINSFAMHSLIGIGNIKVSLVDPVRVIQKLALYLQADVRTEQQTYYSAVVPQTSLTILRGSFHAKILAGRSFTLPLLENIRLNITNNNGDFTLKPEFTNTFEMEIGFDIGKKSYTTANLFSNKTNGTITYTKDGLGNENYNNGPQIGTSGIELHSKFVGKSLTFYLNGSLYQTNARDSIYLVSGTRSNFGIPNQKLNSILAFNLENIFGLKNTWLNISYTLLGKQYQYTDENMNFNSIAAKNYMKTILNFKNIKASGFKFSIGIYDIFNQGMFYIQPYNGGHATLPGLGREYVLKMVYDLPIK